MRWWIRLTFEQGSCSEYALPAGYGATWRLGAARGCDVRIPELGTAREVRFDRWQKNWYVSAPGAVSMDGVTQFVGKEMGHGDGFTVAGVQVAMILRAQWNEGEAFGALRAALHGRDWSSAVDILYTWPRKDLTTYRQVEDYARALLERMGPEDLTRLRAPAMRALLGTLRVRT